MSKSKTSPRGRDPVSGIFVPVKVARSSPRKYIVESVPKPGFGDTGRSKRK